MRFRILNTWLLVTAVIASLSLPSCKKDQPVEPVLPPTEDYGEPKDTTLYKPSPDRHSYCKDGEQLDIKTVEEFQKLLRSCEWWAVAAYENVARREPPASLDPLVIVENEPYKQKLQFNKDSIITVKLYDLDSLGREKLRYSYDLKYSVMLSPEGKFAARVLIPSKHPNGTPKFEPRYYYFCDESKLVSDNTYMAPEFQFIYYTVFLRD
ncbi:MAG: hypothetical protein EAZ57_06480 [Cytophagales bacterium]|nr:MAG: hypothetical protein EAZ67_07345 [Cytophagales bacterium]TAF60672.1 MAG: hypothetical protein EAZ57_06480 [Cytophagales bacterium]